MIQNKEIEVAAGYPSPVLDGIEAAPKLGGYVLSTLKESPIVENVLYTTPEGRRAGRFRSGAGDLAVRPRHDGGVHVRPVARLGQGLGQLGASTRRS